MKRADILTKKELLGVLEELFKVLDNEEENAKTTWGELDNLVPKTTWNSETRRCEPVLDENDEPVMEHDWGHVPKKPDEYTDNDKAKLEAIKTIKATLEKLI